MLPSGCAGVGHAGRDGIDSSPNGYLAFDAVDFAGVLRRGGHERAAADRGRFALGIGADDRDRAGGVLIQRARFSNRSLEGQCLPAPHRQPSVYSSGHLRG